MSAPTCGCSCACARPVELRGDWCSRCAADACAHGHPFAPLCDPGCVGCECGRCGLPRWEHAFAGSFPADARRPGDPCAACEERAIPPMDDVPAWLRGLASIHLPDYPLCLRCLWEEALDWRWAWMERLEETDAALVAWAASEREEMERATSAPALAGARTVRCAGCGEPFVTTSYLRVGCPRCGAVEP